MCLHVNRPVYVACNFKCLIETQGLFKVTGNHVHCQWIKMPPLGTKVGLGPGGPHCVTWRTSSPSKRGRSPAPSNFRPMSIVAKRLPISATAEHLFYNQCSAVTETGDRLATIDIAQKRGCCAPLGRAGFPSRPNTIWPGPRCISMPSSILINPAVWPQRTWAEKCWGMLCPPLVGGGWVPI